MQGGKILQKQFIKLIGAALILAATLFSYGVVSLGWFSQNRNVSANSMQVSVEMPDDIIVSTTVHACIGTDINGVHYFYKEPATNNNLKRYSQLVQNNRQLLLHVHFEDPVTVDNISLTASTQTDYFMGDGNHPLLASANGEGDEYDNVLSSIIAFYIVDAEDTTYDSSAAYKVDTLGSPYSFIDKSDDYSMTNILTLVDKQTVSDIYLVIDYNPVLVYKVFSENLGNTAFQEIGGDILEEVFYVWDINLELIKH